MKQSSMEVGKRHEQNFSRKRNMFVQKKKKPKTKQIKYHRLTSNEANACLCTMK